MTNYIYEYYQAIKDGTITVGRWIEKWYEYIVRGLENKAFFYKPKRANKAILFIENFCRHHEGALAPQLIKLELWQKALVSVIFGIVDADGNRQFREVVVVMGRKNGKTLLAAAISAYMAFMDGEYGARIYYVAPKLMQANLCFDAFLQMIKKEPELSKLAKKRRTDVYIESTNTTANPIAFNAKKSDGLNPSLTICDEISSWTGEVGLKQYEVLKSALGARRQPLILSITTSGYANDGIYDELFKRGTAVLNGDSRETRLAPFFYTIDDITKWNDINELQKANPNLNVSVSVDYLLEEIAIAEQSLSKKAEFLTKYACLKSNSSVAWIPYEFIEKASGEHLSLENFKGSYCVCGIDLSRTTDLTAATVVIERDGKLYVFAKFYLPSEKLDEATARDNLPYQAYIQRGFLELSGENFIDYRDCYGWLTSLVEQYELYPLQVGYDRYNATYLTQDLKNYGFHTDDVYQGYNLTPVINEVEGLMRDGKICIGDNDLLKVHLLDTALKVDAEKEKCMIVKLSAHSHIDGSAALLDAFCVRQKYWDEIGYQLLNK